jgi:hypothetical protein
MSFSDRQYFIQSLAQTRNLAVECERGESHDSNLRKTCEALSLAIDRVVGQLVGDESFLHIKDEEQRRA